MAWAYRGYHLWLRIFDKRVLTSDGAYCENEVPEDYAGPELTLEYAQILVYANSAGEFVEFRQMDYRDLLDKDNQIGTGYTYDMYETEITVAATGPSDVVQNWTAFEHTENPDLPVAARAKAHALYRLHLEERGDVPEEN